MLPHKIQASLAALYFTQVSGEASAQGWSTTAALRLQNQLLGILYRQTVQLTYLKCRHGAFLLRTLSVNQI